MSSGITATDSMAYVGETPWHGLGKAVENAMTSEEAIKEAGLDWGVVKVPIYTGDKFNNDGDITFEGGIEIPDQFATIRADNRSYLGIVGSRYTILQNYEAFEFFDSVVGDNLAMYHTVGSLFGGKRIWMLAKIPGELRIENTDDITEKYLLLANGHDGSMTLKMFFTPVRVVCQNTLNAALGSKSKVEGITIRHTPTMQTKVQEAQKALGLAVNYYDNLDIVLNQMAKAQVTQDQIDSFCMKLIPKNDKEGGRDTRNDNMREVLKGLFETGKGNDIPGVKGSAYALLNAATEYTDHFRGTRKTGDNSAEDARLNAIWFGSGADFKAKAFNEAKIVAGIA